MFILFNRRYTAEILPIRRKTQNNQSINNTIQRRNNLIYQYKLIQIWIAAGPTYLTLIIPDITS